MTSRETSKLSDQDGMEPYPPLLVVDDDIATEGITRALLSSGGYTSVAEQRGNAVLRLVRASLVRMVVCELYIACDEGRCIVTALKQERARLPHLRVLVHTRHGEPGDVEWALAAGGDAVVLKTASGTVLLREVGRLLHEGAAA